MEAERAKRNQMGIFACISYVVGNVIGSGIFITPASVLLQSGSIGMALIIWAACGMISLLGGIAYIELGTAIPSDGGDFAYATYVGWSHIAFAFMIVSAILTYPASTAVQAATFGEYVTAGIVQFVSVEVGTRDFLTYLIGVGLLALCTWINMYSQSKYGGYFQIIVTAAKAVILVMVIAIGATCFFTGGATETLSSPMQGSHYQIGTIVMAAYGGLWSYAGWDILNYGAPAVKNPRVALPISLIGGLLFVTMVYVLTNFSFAVVLGPEAMKNSTAVAVDFASTVENWIGFIPKGSLSSFIPFAAAILLLGSLNANIFCSSRILLEAAREGHLFEFLGAEHKKSGSPRAALIFQFIIAILFTLFNVETLINYVSFIIYGQKCVTMAALFYMRYTGKEVDSGVMRMPLIIAIFFFLICTVLVAIPFYTDPWMSIIGALAVGSSMIVYHVCVKRRIRPSAYPAVSSAINSMLLKYLDAEISRSEEAVQVKTMTAQESTELLDKK